MYVQKVWSPKGRTKINNLAARFGAQMAGHEKAKGHQLRYDASASYPLAPNLENGLRAQTVATPRPTGAHDFWNGAGMTTSFRAHPSERGTYAHR